MPDPYMQVIFQQFNGKTYLVSPTPPVMFISRRFIEQAGFEVRPLNPWSLMVAFTKNCWRYWYWRFCRRLSKWGFIDVPSWEYISWRKHFRFAFWKERKHA